MFTRLLTQHSVHWLLTVSIHQTPSPLTHCSIHIVACVCTPTYVCPLNCTVRVCVFMCPITLCIRQWLGVLQEFLWPDGQHASEWGTYCAVRYWATQWTVQCTYVWYAYPAKQTWEEMHKVCMMLRYNDRHMNKLSVSDSLECAILCTLQASILHSAFQYVNHSSLFLLPKAYTCGVTRLSLAVPSISSPSNKCLQTHLDKVWEPCL